MMKPESQGGEVRWAKGLMIYVKTQQKIQGTRRDEVTPPSLRWLLTRQPLSFLSSKGSLRRIRCLDAWPR